MSYLESMLLPGETIQHRATIHGGIYLPAALLMAAGFGLLLLVPPVAVAVFVLGLGWLLQAWLYAYGTELIVTTHRIMAKFGVVRRSTIEVRRDKVESVRVEQGLLGRALGFGSVSVTGSGGTHAPIRYIAHPIAFRSAALQSVVTP